MSIKKTGITYFGKGVKTNVKTKRLLSSATLVK
jgi:hypothetical protein